MVFQDYWDALDDVGPLTKEYILDMAAHDPNISVLEMKSLVDKARMGL